ncbi:uncharacterized protein B4U80_07996 [Leptotrombidium deliense]|uniref:CABIT domain-containing protein n=1 Tax=Leptotrombidium deliense TaxID=299467 RepID=A0A443SRG4_9ACAR|nr:uncharacterized protein B4U80_07996 [Leptotrombidium deliense]
MIVLKTSSTYFCQFFSGWFSLVTNRGQTAGYFGTIDEVAKAQVPYFLTRDEITGFLVPKDPLIINNKTVNSKTKYSQSSHEKTKIKGGTVLRFLGVYEDISALVLGLKNKNSLRSKKSTAPFEHGARYAKCISFANGSSGEVVLIAITETGRFYVVCKHPNVLSYNHVYSIHNLLRIAKLPVTVQLVIGPKPRNYVPSNSSDGKSSIERIENEATTFTAVLCLDEIRVRDVILACTLRPQPLLNEPIREKSSLSSSLRRTLRGNRSTSRTEDSPVLLEFDLDSSFTFVRTFVEKNGTLSTRKIPEMVVQRIAFCNSEAEFWRRQIKISHDVTPKPITDSNQSNNQRKSILNEEFQKKFDKTASIGSRTSNISNVSKISKILQKFWNPLKKSSRKADNDCFDETEDTHTEEVSKEKKMNETCNKSQKHSLKSVSPSSIADYHFYETLRKVDEVKLPPKQKLARKQTLDIIFPEFKVDKNGYILSSQKFVKNSKPEE